MSNQTVETVSSTADRAKVVIAVLAVVAGIVGYYLLGKQAFVLRLASILLGVGVALAIVWSSAPGRRFVGFARDAWSETRRVIWPERKETWMVTAYVFAFVVVMALFLWIVDKSLEWLLYGLILGWRQS
jgi:preprotein translocase subunit SecE